MSDWISIDEWHRCVEMERPGIVFEIRNAEGQVLTTPCILPLPQMPFDWKLPPLQVRAVAESMPKHSDPLPKPKGH
jgi:hypothetical protein